MGPPGRRPSGATKDVIFNNSVCKHNIVHDVTVAACKRSCNMHAGVPERRERDERNEPEYFRAAPLPVSGLNKVCSFVNVKRC